MRLTRFHDDNEGLTQPPPDAEPHRGLITHFNTSAPLLMVAVVPTPTAVTAGCFTQSAGWVGLWVILPLLTLLGLLPLFVRRRLS
jgi:hypothetical protein